MYAVGHMAWGYIFGRLAGKATKTKTITSLLFAVSMLPDVDLFLKPYGIVHRGPLHASFTLLCFSLPFLIVYRRRALPYIVSVFQHLLFGDFIIGSSMLLWPFSSRFYGLRFRLGGSLDVTLELVGFVSSLWLLFRLDDIRHVLSPEKWNVAMIFCGAMIFLSVFYGIGILVPLVLVLPHIVFLVLFAVSGFCGLYGVFLGHRKRV